jgi:GNAT superfamily N-acetyltransferase
MDLLQSALAFDRAVRVRGVQRSLPIPGGLVVLHDGLRDKYVLNAVMLDAPLPAGFGADELSALADRHLAHLSHRFAVVDDGTAAEALVPAMRAAGWKVQRVVFMRWVREPDRPARAGVARRIDENALRKVQLAIALEERAASDASAWIGIQHVDAIVDGEAAVRAGTRAVGFGAGDDGHVSSSATLFLDRPEGEGGIAMIDEVGTLAEARGRGLARAAVAAALAAARASGCDPIVIPADADDWPRELYARMGFEPLGTQLSFVREDVRS